MRNSLYLEHQRLSVSQVGTVSLACQPELALVLGNTDIGHSGPCLQGVFANVDLRVRREGVRGLVQNESGHEGGND